jgi:hypothetical protein
VTHGEKNNTPQLDSTKSLLKNSADYRTSFLPFLIMSASNFSTLIVHLFQWVVEYHFITLSPPSLSITATSISACKTHRLY